MAMREWLSLMLRADPFSACEAQLEGLLRPGERVLACVSGDEPIPRTGRKYSHLFCLTPHRVIAFVEKAPASAGAAREAEVLSYDDIEVGVRRFLRIAGRPHLRARLPSGAVIVAHLRKGDYRQVRKLLRRKRALRLIRSMYDAL